MNLNRGAGRTLAQDVKYVFDLDGTLTRVETLPLIARHFHIEEEIAELTERTIRGHIPFDDSFLKRVGILGQFPVNEVDQLLADIPLFEGLLEFIQRRQSDCVVATGNLDIWISTLLKRFGCQVHSSRGQVVDGKVSGVTHILRKSDVVAELQARGSYVVFVGDGDNDAGAMRLADLSIACGLVHEPAEAVIAAADHIAYRETRLLDLLADVTTPA
ncbi:HAD family phosphatase [Aliiroseovarius crassostreae]|uniref:HAD family phosphatase n=1 Tax=Aliiroseovarius crassostreae TaxID=154981 RepID=UPI0021FE7639|nr:HAD family phosphatase [Aliiroseovarius crassostreae]UWQ07626.1 HAD family phosphatase [Aliiroseovarius crassostreae]